MHKKSTIKIKKVQVTSQTTVTDSLTLWQSETKEKTKNTHRNFIFNIW